MCRPRVRAAFDFAYVKGGRAYVSHMFLLDGRMRYISRGAHSHKE